MKKSSQAPGLTSTHKELSSGGGPRTIVPGATCINNIKDVEALVGRLLRRPADALHQAAPVGHTRRTRKRHHQHPLPCTQQVEPSVINKHCSVS